MRRLGRFAVVAGAGVLVLSMFGCTPDEPGPGSTPDPAPSSPAASPTESDEDRAERERGEHAIEVYEKADDELNRLLHEGAGTPSAEFKKYAHGSYLDAITDLLEQVAAGGASAEGEIERLAIWVHGTPGEDRVDLVICEDGSDSYFVDGDGNRLANDEPYVIQTAQVEPVDGDTWQVVFMESERHKSFSGTECGDAS